MREKTFGMRAQLAVGEMGVELAKRVLRIKYPVIRDLQNDKKQQNRGVDLHVEGLGYLEVKTDSHNPIRFFLELEVSGKPGTIYKSKADWFCFFFFNYQKMYLLPRVDLQHWMKRNVPDIKQEHPDWVKTIRSHASLTTWSAKGLVVPSQRVLQGVNTVVVSWVIEDDAILCTVWDYPDGTVEEYYG